MNINPQNFDVFDILSDQGCALVSRETLQIVCFNKAWSSLLDKGGEGKLLDRLPGLDGERMRRAVDRGARWKCDIELQGAKQESTGLRVEVTSTEPDYLFVQVADRSQYQKSQVILDRFVGLLEKRNRELDRINQELEEARERLVVQGRITALGEMARTMIGEMRAPLQLITVYASLLDEQLRDPDTTVMLQGMVESCSRVGRIIETLAGLAQRPRGEAETCNVSQMVHDTLSLCTEQITRQGIALQVDPIDADVVVAGRAAQLSQALLNLLNNAREALSGDDELESRWIRIEVRKQDNGIDIAVIDSGPGIPAQLVSKIMEPFFSLKNEGVGSGTGLGLTIARRAVEAHGGQLMLDTSHPNTCFRIWLHPPDPRVT